jgi:uncharacterized protein (TIGR02145 family)
VENLRVTKYNDGTAILKVTDSVAWRTIEDSNLTTPTYCNFANNTNADSIKKYGALYNWYVMDTKKLAPAGWHVPSDYEWQIMEDYLVREGYNWDNSIGANLIAKAMAAKTDWKAWTDLGAVGCDLTMNNKRGFSGLPAGCRTTTAYFDGIGRYGYWWSTSETDDATTGWYRYLDCKLVSFEKCNYNKSRGYSVRLVRD